jgi:hypothetical protein
MKIHVPLVMTPWLKKAMGLVAVTIAVMNSMELQIGM